MIILLWFYLLTIIITHMERKFHNTVNINILKMLIRYISIVWYVLQLLRFQQMSENNGFIKSLEITTSVTFMKPISNFGIWWKYLCLQDLKLDHRDSKYGRHIFNIDEHNIWNNIDNIMWNKYFSHINAFIICQKHFHGYICTIWHNPVSCVLIKVLSLI